MKVCLSDLWFVVTTGAGANTSLPDEAYTDEAEAVAEAERLTKNLASQPAHWQGSKVRFVVQDFESAFYDVRQEIIFDAENAERDRY